MIYNHAAVPLLPNSVQYRLHIDPSYRQHTGGVRLYQVPVMQENPGGHLAYLVDSWVIDVENRKPQTIDDVCAMFAEAVMHQRIPGIG